jgi:hypothetical protein
MFIVKASLTVLCLLFVLKQARKLIVAPAVVRVALRYASVSLWGLLGLLVIVGLWSI